MRRLPLRQDTHGSGHIYGEVQAAIEITCADCHGTAQKYPNLQTTRPGRAAGRQRSGCCATSDGRARFQWRGNHLYQRSTVYPELEWEVTLVKDTVDPANPKYNPRAARAKLMSADPSMKWGLGIPEDKLAHSPDTMACYTCHLSWTTSCAGCHLPIEANWKTVKHHYEGGETRNFATYNPEVARDDMFQLGIAGTLKGNIIAPIASRSALILTRPTSTARTSMCSSRPCRHRAIRARPSRRTTPTPSAAPRPRPAPTATSPRQNDNNAHHGAAPPARHRLRQFRRLRRLGRRGEEHRGGARHRMGRAAGRARQLSPQIRLSRRVQGASRSRPRTAGSARARLERRALHPAPRRISLCLRGQPRHARL